MWDNRCLDVLDQVNPLEKFYRCYFLFLEFAASENISSPVSHKERRRCHLKWPEEM